MLEYDLYKTPDNAQKLIIFLHGYNDLVQNYKNIGTYSVNRLQHTALLIPQATQICDKNPNNSQWFGMLEHDPDYARVNPQTLSSEIFEIYEKTHADIANAAKQIDEFIQESAKIYNVDEKKIYLAGFSQGAMLALYCALSRKKRLAGVFCFSGIAAAKEHIKVRSRPKVYLFHGTNDNKVQFKTFADTCSWLDLQKIKYQAFTMQGIAHIVLPEEIEQMCKIVSNS